DHFVDIPSLARLFINVLNQVFARLAQKRLARQSTGLIASGNNDGGFHMRPPCRWRKIPLKRIRQFGGRIDTIEWNRRAFVLFLKGGPCPPFSHFPLTIRFTWAFSFRCAGVRPLASSLASPKVKCGSGKGRRAIASLRPPTNV